MTDDDLARLTAYRADVPPPSAEAWRSAHTALAHAIEREAASSRVPGGILEHILRRGRPRRVRWGVRFGLAFAVAIVAVVVAATQRSGSPTAPPPAAAQVLRQLAAVAASQPPHVHVALKAGQYFYTREQSTELDSVEGKCNLLLHIEIERWVAADGSGLERRVEGDRPEFLSEYDRTACAPFLSKVELGVTSETQYGPGCISAAPIHLGKLPTEPNRLRKRLETGKVEGGPPGPGEAFVQIGDLLRQTDASPRLRSALYKAAIGLRGVQSLGERVDRAGRKGVALAIVDHAVREELIFDPHTSALLDERHTVVRTENSKLLPVGAVTEDAVYWPGRIVDELPSWQATTTIEGRGCVLRLGRARATRG